ncbi:MAG: primosomal protein N', partial [Azospirillaceae bacterium]
MLPLPLCGAYDYRLPAGLDAPPGTFVEVPLGSRAVIGVVWDPPGETAKDGGADGTGVEADRLKDVGAVLDAPPLPEVSRRFVDWVARYVMSPPGAVLRMAMSVPAALAPPAPVRAFRPAPAPADGPVDAALPDGRP